MKRFTVAALILTLLGGCITTSQSSSKTADRPVIDGTFTGREPMSNLSPEEEGTRWFHENTLTIQGNVATLDKSPIEIKKGKKWYSASTGGFYTYKGTLNLAGGHWVLHVKLIQSDYAPVRIGADRKAHNVDLQYIVALLKDGTLMVNGVIYTKK